MRSRHMFLRRLTTSGSNWPSLSLTFSDGWKSVPHFPRYRCLAGAPEPLFNISRRLSRAFRPLDPHSIGETRPPLSGLSLSLSESLPRMAFHLSCALMEHPSKEPPHDREPPYKRRRSAEEGPAGDQSKPPPCPPPPTKRELPRQPGVSAAAAADHSRCLKNSPTLYRVWEEVRNQHDRHRSHQRGGRPFDFSVLSYNILSQDLLHDNSYLYQHCPTAILGWGFRLANLLRELRQHNADILCLQEVQENHYEEQIRPALEALGYQCEYKRRTGRKPDGCAVAFRKARFSLVSSHPVEFLRPGVPLLDRDNVALILLLRPRGPAGRSDPPSSSAAFSPPLCVANTHLLYNPRRGDIKLAQLAVLLAEVGRVSRLPDGSSCPLLLCGDLNSVPWSPLYSFLRMGSLEYQGMPTARVSGQEENFRAQRVLTAPIWPPSLGISQRCQYQPTDVNESISSLSVQDQPAQATADTHCSRIEHSLSLSSAYSHFLRHDGRPEITTCHSRTAITVDYILYSPGPGDVASHPEHSRAAPPPCGRGLQLLSRLGLVGLSELKEVNGLPNQHHSSDHLPLLARFRLCP